MLKSAITARFGAAVRNLRFRRGLSQEELAERADLHRTYIAGIERGGRNVTIKSVEKLAQALEVSVVDLLNHNGEEPGATKATGADNRSSRCAEILLAEGDPADVNLTLTAFRSMKIANRIHVVTDGAAALDYLFLGRNRPEREPVDYPDLILLDLQLPKVTGFEVLRRLKRDARTQNIPVIVLTKAEQEHEIAESRELGADTHLVKPVDFFSFIQVTPQLRFQWALFEPPAAEVA